MNADIDRLVDGLPGLWADIEKIKPEDMSTLSDDMKRELTQTIASAKAQHAQIKKERAELQEKSENEIRHVEMQESQKQAIMINVFRREPNGARTENKERLHWTARFFRGQTDEAAAVVEDQHDNDDVPHVIIILLKQEMLGCRYEISIKDHGIVRLELPEARPPIAQEFAQPTKKVGGIPVTPPDQNQLKVAIDIVKAGQQQEHTPAEPVDGDAERQRLENRLRERGNAAASWGTAEEKKKELEKSYRITAFAKENASPELSANNEYLRLMSHLETRIKALQGDPKALEELQALTDEEDAQRVYKLIIMVQDDIRERQQKAQNGGTA